MAGEQDRVFKPLYESGVLKTNISNTALTDVINVKKCTQAVITNLGTVPCYIKFSKTSRAATTADYLLPPNNASISLTIDPETDYVSYLSSSSTTVSVHIIFGNGM